MLHPEQQFQVCLDFRLLIIEILFLSGHLFSRCTGLRNIYILQCIREQFWTEKRILVGMPLLIYGHWLWHFTMLLLDFFLFVHIKALVKIKSQWVKWPKIDQKVPFQQRSQDQLQLKSFGLLIYQKLVDSLVNSDGQSLSKFKILSWSILIKSYSSLIATLMDGCTFDDYFKMTGDIEGNISIH